MHQRLIFRENILNDISNFEINSLIKDMFYFTDRITYKLK